MSETVESAAAAETPPPLPDIPPPLPNLPPPIPPALTQVQVAEQIRTLLQERQTYRQQVGKTLVDLKSAIADLTSWAGPTTTTAGLGTDDLISISRAIGSGKGAIATIQDVEGERARQLAALKEAESNQRKMMMWGIGGGAVFLFIIIANLF